MSTEQTGTEISKTLWSEVKESLPAIEQRRRDLSPKRATGDVDWNAPEFNAPLSEAQRGLGRMPSMYETWTPLAQYVMTRPSERPFPLLGRYYDLLRLRNKAQELGVRLSHSLLEQWPTYYQLQLGLNWIDRPTLQRILEACDRDDAAKAKQQQEDNSLLQKKQSDDLLCYEDMQSLQ